LEVGPFVKLEEVEERFEEGAGLNERSWNRKEGSELKERKGDCV
jgi:hypothetical protein